jgi:hypothetical protein
MAALNAIRPVASTNITVAGKPLKNFPHEMIQSIDGVCRNFRF